jgi:hypothetical protein
MDIDPYKTEIETKEIKSGTLSNTDPRYYNHEASTVDQTIKSRSRGRCVTGMAT